MLTCEGEIYEAAGENARARTQYEQAVAVATDARDDEMLAGALFLRGYLWACRANTPPDSRTCGARRACSKSSNMPTHALTTLNAIAILYNRMGDYAQAEHIYTRALKAQREAGLHREVAVTLYNLGRAHENQQQWDPRAALSRSPGDQPRSATRAVKRMRCADWRRLPMRRAIRGARWIR